MVALTADILGILGELSGHVAEPITIAAGASATFWPYEAMIANQ